MEHEHCCWGKGFIWQQNALGEVFKVTPLPPELVALIERLRQQYIARFGKAPDPNSLIVPQLLKASPEQAKRAMAAMMEAAEVAPAIIYAFRKTGLIPTDLNENLLTGAEIRDWNAALAEYHRQHPSTHSMFLEDNLELNSTLVPRAMRRIYTKEEIRTLFRAFWNLQEVKSIGRQALLEIICEAKHLNPGKVNRASAAKKAQWCEELLENPEMSGVLRNVFRKVHPTGFARCAAALNRAKAGPRLTFEGFMQEGGFNQRDALLFLLLYWPSNRIPIAPNAELITQGAVLNGILSPEPVEPNPAWN